MYSDLLVQHILFISFICMQAHASTYARTQIKLTLYLSQIGLKNENNIEEKYVHVKLMNQENCQSVVYF